MHHLRSPSKDSPNVKKQNIKIDIITAVSDPFSIENAFSYSLKIYGNTFASSNMYSLNMKQQKAEAC